jgi:hypothetical protein
LEKVTKNPFANPKRRRPRYKTPGVVVPIWIPTATALTMQASHNAWRLPRYAEKKPATSDETNEPRVRRDVMSCWTVLWSLK